MGRRHRSREIALKLLYQLDLSGQSPDEALGGYLQDRRVPPDIARFARELVEGTWCHREELDRLLGDSAERWKVDRMPAVDRNLLRLAAFELAHPEEAPPAVVIDEALELAKRYCDAESGPFINGVLDQVRKHLESRSTDGDTGD